MLKTRFTQLEIHQIAIESEHVYAILCRFSAMCAHPTTMIEIDLYQSIHSIITNLFSSHGLLMREQNTTHALVYTLECKIGDAFMCLLCDGIMFRLQHFLCVFIQQKLDECDPLTMD